MSKAKRILALILTLVIVSSAAPLVSAASSSNELKLYIDGVLIVPDVPYIIQDGVTLVPLKFVIDAFGARGVWDGATVTATVTNTLHVIKFTVGSRTYTIDGAAKTLAIAPVNQNGRVMVPLRAISEAFGAEINYDEKTHTGYINYFSNPALSGTVHISGSTTVQPIATEAAEALKKMNDKLSISVSGGGSGTGISEAINGTVNIGMSSRDLRAEEAAQLSQFVIAHDGVAIIVNNNNDVKNLTTDQVKKIFTGEIMNWNEVGGPNAPIIVYTRESTSGTLAALQDILGIRVKETATPTDSTGLMRQAVAADRNGIGYISSGQVDVDVKALTIGNIAPSIGNVKSGAYPICRDLILVVRGAPGAITAMYIDFLLSKAGQKLVTDERYISVID